MTIAHPENCIGCEACSRICPKKCYTHAPLTAEGG
jgi:NAD-dependent dihydropyrimidine dehydrogenase PreA subunit